VQTKWALYFAKHDHKVGVSTSNQTGAVGKSSIFSSSAGIEFQITSCLNTLTVCPSLAAEISLEQPGFRDVRLRLSLLPEWLGVRYQTKEDHLASNLSPNVSIVLASPLADCIFNALSWDWPPVVSSGRIRIEHNIDEWRMAQHRSERGTFWPDSISRDWRLCTLALDYVSCCSWAKCSSASAGDHGQCGDLFMIHAGGQPFYVCSCCEHFSDQLMLRRK